jgi:DNA/RNA-binding domain of Phe-tRNA-synthetase-like protein
MFQVSERWMTAYPDAMVAVLVVKGATNAQEHPALEARKRSLEADLRSRFADPDAIKSAEAIAPYVAYYKRFEKTYHLMQQLKTVVVKGRPMPTVSGLVDVMFMAEMRNLLLTAGHDLATVELPITLDVCTGEERYVKLNGEEQLAKAGDMMVVDRRGVLSSVIHGPDFRSRIAPQTRDVLYVVYAPSGITRDSAVRHVADMADSILLFSPSAQAEPVRILSARGVEQIGL